MSLGGLGSHQDRGKIGKLSKGFKELDKYPNVQNCAIA